ncbi:unnamed protein product [Fusarium graminearum]|uniref:Chromosome 4, complete genome n=1 Tax=Gibberella zeae (strain ATCC MYA-4620 / CBS 123657 / FGSC 9075 / NRRL 31084 / PH-1) TaxID=229533 RepID=A0A098DV05_GIBZE|nr:unnamed protein product [Fusarium graminearum]CZS72540.1 unnamed protein product [Fusarium graminearum]
MKTIAINLPELVRSDPYGQREFALTAGPVCVATSITTTIPLLSGTGIEFKSALPILDVNLYVNLDSSLLQSDRAGTVYCRWSDATIHFLECDSPY